MKPPNLADPAQLFDYPRCYLHPVSASASTAVDSDNQLHFCSPPPDPVAQLAAGRAFVGAARRHARVYAVLTGGCRHILGWQPAWGELESPKEMLDMLRALVVKRAKQEQQQQRQERQRQQQQQQQNVEVEGQGQGAAGGEVEGGADGGELELRFPLVVVYNDAHQIRQYLDEKADDETKEIWKNTR